MIALSIKSEHQFSLPSESKKTQWRFAYGFWLVEVSNVLSGECWTHFAHHCLLVHILTRSWSRFTKVCNMEEPARVKPSARREHTSGRIPWCFIWADINEDRWLCFRSVRQTLEQTLIHAGFLCLQCCAGKEYQEPPGVYVRQPLEPLCNERLQTREWSDNVSDRFVIIINALRADQGYFDLHSNTSVRQWNIIQIYLLRLSVNSFPLSALYGDVGTQSFAVFYSLKAPKISILESRHTASHHPGTMDCENCLVLWSSVSVHDGCLPDKGLRPGKLALTTPMAGSVAVPILALT